ELRRHTFRARRPPNLDHALYRVFDSLIADGAAHAERLTQMRPKDPLAESPLAYRLRADGATYFGAAHGLAGVLYVLLHLPERCRDGRARELIVGALDFLLSIQKDGNFPGAIEPTPELVHWCHGAPGIIPTLCKAYEVFGDARYLDAARRAADCVWTRGI